MEYEKAKKRYLPMSETMFLILFSLREERHGYGIMLYVKELTEGRILLGAGTIYQSLGKLERDGLIRATGETARRKRYRITPLGQEILSCEAARIRELYQIVEEFL